MQNTTNWPSEQLPDGWIVSTPKHAENLARELETELPKKHILKSVPVRVIANRDGTDDILCQHVNEPKRFTVVHLTWKGREEIDGHPSVEVDGTFDDFIEYENNYLGN